VRRGAAAAIALAVQLGACIAPPASAPEKALQSRAAPVVAARPHCSWPNGARAAVSLTYDDALASQLKFAVPVLDRAAIKATFFLSGSNLADFAALAKSGHELASHTVRHPCNADLAALSMAEMESELDAGNLAVQALGVSGKLTFAYPCGQMSVKNGESYVPLVKQRFRAARGVAAAVAAPESVDLFNVPALFAPPTSDGADVLAFIQRAEQSQGWAVIGVHGVSEAGEYLQLAQPVHDAVVAYLAEHTQTIWTAPFGTVADQVAACR
jgi:peptidoglycan/xylan/chitin deacetylase (PgdA/CDA1 family)